MKDDDEEEDNTFGVQRYPCMPSLVGLQQMRNRLHLAFLGRKLMKWTALATGRELRRLASELHEAYEGFSEDMRNAFILLARCRYFYPQLNHIVVEDVPKRAAVLVKQSTKQVSSVKILQFDIIETEYPPYEHLGIGKGGQTILETKKAWLELLKRIIMMLQLRSSFLMVEIANKNATKKMNVLNKIVIPRTNVTNGYILTELEEMAREEFHRLKKVKEKKKRDRDLKEKKPEKLSDTPCRMCAKNQLQLPSISELKVGSRDITENSLVSGREEMKEHLAVTCEAHRLDYLKLILNDLIIYGKDLVHTGIEKIDISEFLNMCERTKLQIDELFKVDEQRFDTVDPNLEQKLFNLKLHLKTVIGIIHDFQPEITLSPSVTNFVHVSQDVVDKLDMYLKNISVKQKHSNKNPIEDLKDIVNDVKKITTEYKKQGILSQDVDEFIESCDEMKSKLEKHFKGGDNACSKTHLKSEQSFKCVDSSKIGAINFESKLEHLKSHLHEVIDIIKEIEPGFKLPFDLASFIRMCQDVEERLNIYKEDESTASEGIAYDKLKKLKNLITGVTNITNDYKESGLLDANVDEFLKSCNEMKLKIDTRDKKVTESASHEKVELKRDDLQHLIQHIDDTISLGIEAKVDGVIGGSVEDFIQAFEELKSKIESKSLHSQQPDSSQPEPVILDLQSNIQDIMSMVKQLKEEEVITVSVEDFLRICDETVAKMKTYERTKPSTSQKESNYESGESRINTIDSKSVLKRENPKQTITDENPPCGACSTIFEFINPSNESLCITCSNSVDKQQEIKRESPIISSDCSSSCNLCKLIANEREKERAEKTISEKVSKTESENEETSPEVNDNLGYFEMQTHKKVKVTTKQNPDGTVWEEKETITINTVKRDPTVTSLLSDDDETSDEYLDEGSAKHVNLCTLPDRNSNGFDRSVKSTQSDVGPKNFQLLTEPCFRQCVSLENIFFF